MLQTTRLAPVISLKDYKNSAQPLMQTPPIFIIMLEAVSSNHVGFNGYQRKDITPNMDTFARESLIFVNAFSASTHSNYAQTSFHSSQYARRKKSLDMFTRIDYHTTLLSDILAAYGYQTAFISAQNEDWQGMKNFTLHDSSFDHYYHSKNALGQNIAIERKIDDALVIEEAKRTLKKFASDKPIYMYLNLQRTHFPYNLHPDAPRNYKPYKLSQKVSFFHYPARLIPVIKNRFDNALRYVDQELGNFFAFLKKRGLYDQAIIVVAADHGEAFYEKGYPTHGTSLFNDQVKPLLLIKTPYSQLKGPRQDAISLIDVNPSILELLNLPNHPNFQGRQIIKSNPGARNIYMTNQGAIHADGLVQYPWKFIKSKKDGQRLINLELDPTEKIDYSRLFPDKKKELEQSLAKHITQQLQYYNNLSAEQRKLFYPPQF